MPEASMLDRPKSAYLHIPFCRRRCFYCDFPVTVVGDRRSGQSSPAIDPYVTQLCREIELTAERRSVLDPLETVFFGGGTPSLLSGPQLVRILGTLDRTFGIASGAEISIEMDPATFDRTKVEAYIAAGITRVSLGVQAFQDSLLAACGRSHGAADIPIAVDQLQRAGIRNWSLDLISGLPGQSLADWRESLARAIDLAPNHLSAYDLVLEPQTVFGKRYGADGSVNRLRSLPGAGATIALPDDETTAAMYRIAQAELTAAGYRHYEISNYAQPGFACRHNRVYWENRPYFAFGMGAASAVDGVRLTRPRTTTSYATWVDRGALAEPDGTEPDGIEPDGTERVVIEPIDRLLEDLMLGLRLAEGLAIAELTVRHGAAAVERLQMVAAALIDRGWLLWDDRLRLTDPEGFLFSNQVLATMFEQLDDRDG
jgi:putative oxygen-independent coproporphyrinogen III oxidase